MPLLSSPALQALIGFSLLSLALASRRVRRSFSTSSFWRVWFSPRNRLPVLLLGLTFAFGFSIWGQYLITASRGFGAVANGAVSFRMDSDALVFLLAGQSNMAGRGGIVMVRKSIDRGNGISDGGDDDDRDDSPRTKVWDVTALTERELALTKVADNDDSIVRMTADGRWIRAVEPMHADIDIHKTCGIGPGLIFARSVAADLYRSDRRRRRQIALVPCAVGGTKISEWSRGQRLYSNMITRAKLAMATALDDRRPIEALLWYQGESDCGVQEDAIAYRGRLREFVRNVREDLGLPSLRIVMVAVWASNIAHTLPFAESHVRPAIFSIANEDPLIRVADAKGLSFLSDNIHLTSESQFILAERISLAYLDLVRTAHSHQL